MIASLYVVLTYVSMLLGIDKGVIQCRLSEALCVLPIFFEPSVSGLFVGCLISNLLTGCALWDIVFGSLATLIAAILTSKLKRLPYLAPIPSIVMNTIVIPPVLAFVYHVNEALPFIFLTVFLGELISCGLFGTILIYTLKRLNRRG